MTILTLPNYSGLSFPVKKSPTFSTIAHKSVSGVSTAQSLQPYPLYAYELPFEFLRSSDAHAELQSLMSFYEACEGRGLPFYFDDPDDNAVTGQLIGQGDGETKDFAFVRTMGIKTIPVQSVTDAGIVVRVNGDETADYTLLTTSQFGTNYGLSFTNAPGAGQQIDADFSFKWLCQFDEDVVEFSKFTKLNGRGLWEAKSLKFTLWGQ